MATPWSDMATPRCTHQGNEGTRFGLCREFSAVGNNGSGAGREALRGSFEPLSLMLNSPYPTLHTRNNGRRFFGMNQEYKE
eukprot:scaffold318864_cov13-Tisochrysis_lutea.AAC.1